MVTIHFKHIYWLLLCFIFFTACADKNESESGPRGYQKEELEAYKDEAKYQYLDEKQVDEAPASSNFFTKLMSAILGFIAFFFNSVLGYLILAALVVGLIYILLKTVKPKPSSVYNRESAIRISKEEDIEKADYNFLLESALRNSDYRLAIRYVFLQSLQVLQFSGRINWHKEKTNHTYLGELKPEKQADYLQLVTIYEYVWYGEFAADNHVYQKAKAHSEQLIK